MPEDPEHLIYSYVQGLFRRGTVIVVGSGASCGLGLPSMWDLAKHLIAAAPDQVRDLPKSSKDEWARVEQQLAAGIDLENALGSGTAPEPLVDLVTGLIADCVVAAEEEAIAAILGASSPSAFGLLFRHALKTSTIVDVITTNYDRLVEVHAAHAGVRVDTMYYGDTVGLLDARLSHEELCFPQNVAGRGRAISIAVRPHVRLAKPHGSLDWFAHNDQIFRSDLTVPGARRIIAPGGSKYRLGYEAPYSEQRARANAAITDASAMFFVGYGFNDDHLQTHLRPEVPTVVISKTLTEKARAYLSRNPSAVGIESADDVNRCLVTQGTTQFELEHPLWDLNHLVKEVLSI